jgi:predicted ATP-binding protein involved in virulence
MSDVEEFDSDLPIEPGHRLIRLQINGLLGRFDHKIEFPLEWNFIILHGPNGVGKTTILEIIDSCFNRRFDRLSNAPFGQCAFFFSDESSLRVVSQSAVSEFDRGDGGVVSVITKWLTLTHRDPHGEIHEWSSAPVLSSPSTETVEYLARLIGATRSPASGRWRDPNGTLMDDDELFADYSDRLPVRIPPSGAMPPQMNRFFRSIEVYLIETQRLLANRRILKRPPTAVGRRPRRSTSRVMDYSEDFTRRIRSALARNSTISQRRDRTFPRRVLSLGVHSGLPSESQIRTRYEKQRETRNQLAEIAVLDMAEDVPLPDRQLEDWQRIVLATYLDDAEEKLATFEHLLSRLTVLRDIVNSRFQYKKLTFDRDRGFVFRTDDGFELSAEQLSSGEQHELVLIYDLLFNVSPQALVLIDEPELSLHVAWQQRFLSDITQISDLNGLRFIVATHSPQIVHKNWSKMVALGSVEGPDEVEE